MSWAGDGERHQHGDGGDHAAEHAVQAHGADGGRARRMALSLGVTVAIMVAEAVGGWLSGSLALISDAGHMLTDAAALGLALVAIHLASRPADEKRTYGYRRVEVLAAQINVAALFGLVAWIAWEAAERLRTPHPGIGLGLMASVAAVGLAGNLLVLAWLRHDRSLNARSAFLHVLGDAISSVAVLGAALAMWLRPSLRWLDPALSLLIAMLILWGALRLVLEITDILMEAVPRHLDVPAVCGLMEEARGVLAVHDLHIWTISSGSYALSAHLVVEAGAMGQNDSILDEVKARLRRSCGIDHTTLQIESADYAHLYDVHSH
ncbi:MAG TPA: cation diffusion facilitator family transporter [Anaeromyxobacteraceae bacterium]|nr:cation diffusion facilitator family transporter [Anaeromyxobacteraceae bacterium]